jgi:hypothetical protein
VTLREYFNANHVSPSGLAMHYLTAHAKGLTKSFSSFRRHYQLWKASLRPVQHMPPPVTGHALGQFAGATA